MKKNNTEVTSFPLKGLSGAHQNKSLISYQSVLLNCHRETKHTVQIEKVRLPVLYSSRTQMTELGYQDLKRTFPGNEKLGKSDEEGIAALRRVLIAYSCVNTGLVLPVR